MKQNPYLNPFQPFPERNLDLVGEERPRSAIEDNMSRAMFSALLNTENPAGVLALILQELARERCSPDLERRVAELCESLRSRHECPVEVHLQSWPPQKVIDDAGPNVFLIGISSDHRTDWTHNQRTAPENPRADAWIDIPGKALLVFECKNDQYPQDATQIGTYAHMLFKSCSFPRAEPRETLKSREEAEEVQAACKTHLVIDAPWSAVIKALKPVHLTSEAGSLGRWLAGQAAVYIEWHVRPPYQGPQTVLEWLNGPNTPDRREHLRTLIEKMGQAIHEAAKDLPDAITFGKLGLGASGASIFVRLLQGGNRLQLDWLGNKADFVLWFMFHEQFEKRIGVEHYLEVRGASPNARGVDQVEEWNTASARHTLRMREFEEAMAAWVCNAPSDSLLDVTAVKFKGKKRNWQGSGATDHEGPGLIQASPQEAQKFVQANRERLWIFPEVRAADEIPEAARRVRKPALSWVVLFNPQEFADCGMDGKALQSLLRRKVDAAKH